MIRSATLSLMLVLGQGLGCQASVQASGSANTSGNAELSSTNPSSSSDESARVAFSENGGADDGSLAPLPLTKPALFGARAGLHLEKGTAANCRCLAVVAGPTNDRRFRWDGQVPTVDPNGQIVVALSSEGLDCPEAPKEALGASYHGYETVGADVIIQVETGRMGRPLAGGAVVPKPTATGRILVRPVERNSPYGRALDGKNADCVVWTAP